MTIRAVASLSIPTLGLRGERAFKGAAFFLGSLFLVGGLVEMQHSNRPHTSAAIATLGAFIIFRTGNYFSVPRLAPFERSVALISLGLIASLASGYGASYVDSDPLSPPFFLLASIGTVASVLISHGPCFVCSQQPNNEVIELRVDREGAIENRIQDF